MPEASGTSEHISRASSYTFGATNEPSMVIKDVSDTIEVYLGDTEILSGSLEEKTDTIVDGSIAILEAAEASRVELVASDEVIATNNEISAPSLNKKSGSLGSSIQ